MKSKMIILKIIVFFIFKFFRAEGDNIDVLKPMKRSVDSLSISKMQAPIITTNYGKIAGKTVPVDGDGLAPVVQYLGIPYAKPPVKALRWRKPEDTRFWNEVLNATTFQAVCPQADYDSLPKALLPVWYKPEDKFVRERSMKMSEDCLYLNIYVPSSFYNKEPNFGNPELKGLPVMVYFHGHTFSEGSGNFYDGSVLASYGEVIVVTFNYRLGVLGFLSTNDKVSLGNYGLWDQIKMLEWVASNIRDFGGDPDRVTAFGSGSGASSIGILMLSAATEGKRKGNITRAWFQRAILQSGTSISSWSVAKKSLHNTQKLASNSTLDCPVNSSKAMIDCLRSKTWRELLSVPVPSQPYEVAFGPVVDGSHEILKDEPFELFNIGEFTDYSIIIGTSKADGYGYVQNMLNGCNTLEESIEKCFSSTFETNYSSKNFDSDVLSLVQNLQMKKKRASLDIGREIAKFTYKDWGKIEKNFTSFKKALINMYSDRYFVRPAITKTNYQVEHHHPAYFYVFDHYPGSDKTRSWVGSAIGEELPFVFGAPMLRSGYPLFPYRFTSKDKNISMSVMSYWTNFAKEGNPTPSSRLPRNAIQSNEDLVWPRYDYDSQYYLKISDILQTSKRYREKELEMWRSLLPNILNISNLEMQSKVDECKTGKPRKYWPPDNSPPNCSRTAFPTQDRFSSAEDATEANAMSMQLSITLAVGFFLLFANIIIFAVVSYRKEKDKILIEKMKNELKHYHRRDLVQKSKTMRRSPHSKARADNALTIDSAVRRNIKRETDPNNFEPPQVNENQMFPLQKKLFLHEKYQELSPNNEVINRIPNKFYDNPGQVAAYSWYSNLNQLEISGKLNHSQTSKLSKSTPLIFQDQPRDPLPFSNSLKRPNQLFAESLENETFRVPLVSDKNDISFNHGSCTNDRVVKRKSRETFSKILTEFSPTMQSKADTGLQGMRCKSAESAVSFVSEECLETPSGVAFLNPQNAKSLQNTDCRQNDFQPYKNTHTICLLPEEKRGMFIGLYNCFDDTNNQECFNKSFSDTNRDATTDFSQNSCQLPTLSATITKL